MVNFKRLADQAKKLVNEQGGSDVVKAKAEDLREIAQGEGSVSDKAKAAADVVKEDRSGDASEGSDPTSTDAQAGS